LGGDAGVWGGGGGKNRGKKKKKNEIKGPERENPRENGKRKTCSGVKKNSTKKSLAREGRRAECEKGGVTRMLGQSIEGTPSRGSWKQVYRAIGLLGLVYEALLQGGEQRKKIFSWGLIH